VEGAGAGSVSGPGSSAEDASPPELRMALSAFTPGSKHHTLALALLAYVSAVLKVRTVLGWLSPCLVHFHSAVSLPLFHFSTCPLCFM
jgi:hypothetical protein